MYEYRGRFPVPNGGALRHVMKTGPSNAEALTDRVEFQPSGGL